MKRAGAGKAKGSSFERTVARELSLWLSCGERDDLLWRSAMSGGRATLKMKKGELSSNQTGDLSGVSRLGHCFTDLYSVECKAYKNLQVQQILFGGTNGILQFWQQACKDAQNKQPLLIAKQDYKPILLVAEPDSMHCFYRRQRKQFVVAESPKWGLSITLFSDFLKHVDPKKVVLDVGSYNGLASDGSS